jgi:hypothetical protein
VRIYGNCGRWYRVLTDILSRLSKLSSQGNLAPAFSIFGVVVSQHSCRLMIKSISVSFRREHCGNGRSSGRERHADGNQKTQRIPLVLSPRDHGGPRRISWRWHAVDTRWICLMRADGSGPWRTSHGPRYSGSGRMASDRWLTGCWCMATWISGDESWEDGILADREEEGLRTAGRSTAHNYTERRK